MSSFHRSPFSPKHYEHIGSLTREPDHPTEEIDVTSPEGRYKIRAAYTIIAQINTLLRDVQANPHPDAVPEEYVPFASLGEDEQLAPVDITTPRPLKRSTTASTRKDRGKRFDVDDVFSSEPDERDPFSSSMGNDEDQEEDGRLTALAAVAAHAKQDPRLATVQGLLQHVDQLVLGSTPGADNTVIVQAATTYPSWIAPQLGQVLGRINSMYPTERRKRADALAAKKAAEFRAEAWREQQRDMDAASFEAFLDKNVAKARERQAKLQEIQAAKEMEDAATGLGLGQQSSSSKKSLKKSKCGVSGYGSDDPFGGSDDGNERVRLAKRAALLRSLSPKARQAWIAEEREARGVRGGASLKDTTHRPGHEKPFGYESHKRMKIGDPPPPVERNRKYDAKPRKAPGLLEPKKIYAVPTSKEKYAEFERRKALEEQEREQGGGGYEAQEEPDDDGEEERIQQEEGDEDPFGSGDDQQQHEEDENRQEEDAADDDDDPFAAHDAEPRPAKRSSAVPRSSMQPQQQQQQQQRRRPREEEEKEQSFSQQQLVDNEQDDPFASLGGSSGSTSNLQKRASSAASIRSGGSSTASTKALKSLTATSRPGTTASKLASAGKQQQNRGSLKKLTKPSATGAATKRSKSPVSGARKKSLASSSSSFDPFAPSNALSRTSLGLSSKGTFDPSDPEDWKDVELKLTAMHQELSVATEQEVKREVSAALAKLSESLHDIGGSGGGGGGGGGRDRDTRAGGATEREEESLDMNTLQWDAALDNVFAKGKRIVQSPSARSLGGAASPPTTRRAGSMMNLSTGSFSPNSTLRSLQGNNNAPISPSHANASQNPFSPSSTAIYHPTPDLLHSVSSALATTQVELASTRSEHARLEKEKHELQDALEQLKERDEQHAKSLFLLMEKLNSLNATQASGSKRNRTTGSLGSITTNAARRAQLRDAAFIAPFGSPVHAGKRAPLGTPGAHGTRSLHLPSPSEIEYETSMEQGVVEGLEDSIVLEPRRDIDPNTGAVIDPPPRGDDDQEGTQTEERLKELALELQTAQQSNIALREKLDAAVFQSAVLTRTAEQQKLFLAQTMVQQSESERMKEQSRLHMQQQQHQEDLRKVQATERRIYELTETQRLLKQKYEQERKQSEKQSLELNEQILLLSEEKTKALEDSTIMKARLEQLEQEQQALQKSRSGGGGNKFLTPSKFGASSSSSTGTPSDSHTLAQMAQMDLHSQNDDFFYFLASSFRGDYLKLRHNVPLTHTLQQQALLAYNRGDEFQTETEDVLFSDYVTKYNRRNTPQQRVIILTSHALYNFLPKKFELKRRIAIKDLKNVSLSRLCTDLVILHHTVEHDYLLTTPKRAEFMFHLQSAYKRLMNGKATLPYEFSERLYVKDKGGMMRDIQILDSQSFKLGKPFGAQGAP